MLMKKINPKTMCLVCAAALTVAFGSGCGKKKEDTSAAEVEKILIPARAAVAVKRDVTQSLNFSGNIDAFRRAVIAPAAMGSRVQKIHVEEGHTVREGQLLVEMEDFQLQQSAAQLAQLEADFKRIEALHSRGSATTQQYDQIRAGYTAAKAGYDLLKKSVQLRAPFSGTIIGRYVNEGELYTGAPGVDGVSGVVAVAQLGRMKIEVMVPEQDFVHLSPGQTALVRTEAYPGMIFEGKIFTVNPALNRMSRTSRVAIEIKNDRQLLKPGMFARVEIVTNTRPNVLAVPASAIVIRDNQPHVFTVENNTAPYVTKPTLVKVETGLVTDRFAQILSGIKEGTVVLTDNNVSLSNNTDIRVTVIER
jgi:RND family efflux transporter MFP subunit